MRVNVTVFKSTKQNKDTYFSILIVCTNVTSYITWNFIERFVYVYICMSDLSLFKVYNVRNRRE